MDLSSDLTNLNVQSFARRFGNRAEAQSILDLLQKQIAYLPGGKGFNNGPLVVLPQHQLHKNEDVITVLKYLGTIPSESSIKRGVTIIINNQKKPQNQINSLIMCCQDAYGSALNRILILHDQENKIEIDSNLSQKIKIDVVSRDILRNMINYQHLPIQLGGIYEYDHVGWVNSRIFLESYSKAVKQRLDLVDTLTVRVFESLFQNNGNQRNSIYGQELNEGAFMNPEMRAYIQELRQNSGVARKELKTLMSKGYSYLEANQLRSNESYEEDQFVMNTRVEKLLKSMEERLHRLGGLWKKKVEEGKVVGNIKEMEISIRNVVDFILGPCDKILSSQWRVGRNLQEADEIRRQHEQLEIKCIDSYGKYAELTHKLSQVLDSNECNQEKKALLQMQFTEMDRVCKDFACRLEARRTVVVASVRLYKLISQISKLLLELGNHLKLLLTDKTLQDYFDALNRLSDELVNVCNLSTQEAQNLKEYLNTQAKYIIVNDTIASDWRDDMHEIDSKVSEIQGDVAAMLDMVEEKKLEVEQKLHLKSCLQNVDEAIEYLEELNELMKNDANEDALKDLPTLEKSQKEFDKAEKTAHKSYELGQKNIQAAYFLCKNSETNSQLLREREMRLREAWAKFHGVFQEARLQAVTLFNIKSDQFLSEVDQILIRVNNRQNGKEMRRTRNDSLPGKVKHLKHYHQQLHQDALNLNNKLTSRNYGNQAGEETRMVENMKEKLAKVYDRMNQLTLKWANMPSTKQTSSREPLSYEPSFHARSEAVLSQRQENEAINTLGEWLNSEVVGKLEGVNGSSLMEGSSRTQQFSQFHQQLFNDMKDRVTKVTLTGLLKQQWDCLFDVLQARVIYASVVQDYYSTFNQATEVLEASKRTTFNNEEELFSVLRSLENQEEALNQSTIAVFKTPIDQNDDTLDIQAIESFIKQQTNAWKQSKEEWLMSLYNSHKKMPVEDNIIRNTYGDEKYKVEEKVGKSDSIGKPLNRLQHKTEKVTHDLKESEQYADIMNSDFNDTTVQKPLKITNGLANQVVSEGKPVEFSVIVTGNPRPIVTWYLNGKEIKNSPDFIIESNGDEYTLKIPEVFNEDRGLYSVSAKNKHSQVNDQARLQVSAPITERQKSISLDNEIATKLDPNGAAKTHPTFSKKLQDTTLDVGDDVILECALPLFPVPDKAKWYKDGVEVDKKIPAIRTSSRHGVHRLVIEKAKKVHSGRYACKTIVDGAVVLTEMTLKINDPSEQYYENTVAQGNNGNQFINGNVSHNYYQQQNTSIPVPPPMKPVEIDPKFSKSSAPKVISGFGKVQLNPNHSVLLQCRVVGEPLPNIQWFKDGRPIRPTTATNKHVLRYNNHTGDCSLTINMATIQDVGHYECVALNKVGRDKCEGDVVFEEGHEVDTTSYLDPHALKRIMTNRPTILGQKEDVYSGVSEVYVEPRFIGTNEDDTVQACIGETVKLSNKITGQPHPDVTWLKDGVEMEKSDRWQVVVNQENVHSLVIKNLKDKDAGVYTCRASNRAGKTTKDVLLVVEENKLNFVSAGHMQSNVRQSATLKDGDDEVSNLKSFASDSSKKKMSNKQSEFQNSLQNEIKNFKSTSNLAPVIPNTKTLPTEVPVVSVLSENHNKESFKEPEPSAPVFMILPSSAIVDEGGRVKFCTKVSGNPVPNVAWSINNLDVFSSSRINVYHDGLMNVLEILKAKKYDHGEVKVLARNYVGSQEHTVSLTVKEPFDFRSKLHPSDNTENKVANNQIISHKESRSDSLPALTSIEARKLTAPLFVEELKDIEVDDGDSLKLCCVVVGHPSPVISWFRNDKDVNMLEDYSFKYDLKTGLCSLLISDCMPDDSGNFVCLAKNNHGLAKTSCFLKVKDSNKKQLKVTKSESLQSSRRLSFNDLKQMLKSNKIEMNKQFKTPKFLKELFDKEVTDGTQASFEVEYDGLPTPSIEWFFKEDLIKPSSDFFIETDNEKQYSKLTIMEIFLDDEGVYRCKATNLMGSASTSCHMKVKDNFKEQSINNETNVLEALKVLEAINMNGSLKETEIENKSFSETISMSSNKSSLRSSPVPSCPSPFSTTTKSSEVHFRTTPVFKKATLELTVPEIISKKEIFLKRTIGLVPNSRQESFMDVSQHRSFSETQITFDKTLSPKINQNDQSTKPLVHKVKTPDSVRKKRRIEAVKRKNSINQMKKDAIKTPPIILKALPTELKVTDGQSFDLFFYVKPLAIQQIITWYFNDKVLNDNPDMETFYDEVNGESILRFFEIFPQDSGIYKCVIQNEHGQVSTSANVIVEDPKFSKIYATEKDQTENNEFFPAQEIPIEVSEIVEIQNNDVEKEIMLHKEEVKEIVNDKIPTLELSQNTQAFEEVPAQTIGKKLNKVDETTQNNESRLENELLKTMEVNEALKNPSTATVSFVEKHTFTSNKSFIQNLVNMVAYTSKQKFQTLLPLKNKESKIENLNFAEVLETCLMSKISQIDYTFKYCCLKLFFMPQENSVNKLSSFKMPICEELTLESHYDEASENSPESFDISNFEKAGKILAMKTTKKKIPKVLPKPTEETENPITTNHIDNEKKNFEKVNSASTGKVIDLFFDCKEFGECQNENSAKFSITKSLPPCLELLESHALKLECHFVNLPSDSSIIWLKDNKEIKKDSRLKIETSKNRTILEIDSLTKRDDALYEVSLKSSSATLKSESRVLVESLKKDSEKDNSNGVVNSLKTQLANRKEVSETQDKPIATISQTARAEDNTDSKSYFSGNVLSQLEAMKKTKYFESPELDKIKVVEEKTEKKKIAETKKQEASPTENSQVKQQNNKLINNKKIKETSNLVDFSPSELSVTSSENTSEFQTKTETETTTKSPQKIRKSSEISVKDKIAEKFNKKPIDELKNGNNKNKTSVEKIGNKDKSKDGREQKYVSTLTEEITYKDVNRVPQKFSTRILKTVEYTNSNSMKYSSKDSNNDLRTSPFKNESRSEFDWSGDNFNTSNVSENASNTSVFHNNSKGNDSEAESLSKFSNLENEYKRWKTQTSIDFAKNDSQFQDLNPESFHEDNESSFSENSSHLSFLHVRDDITNKVNQVDVGSIAKPQSREQSSGDHLVSENKEVQSDALSLAKTDSQTQSSKSSKPFVPTSKINEIETTDEITVETKVTQVKMVSLQLLESGEINLTESTQMQTDTDLNETKRTKEKEELIISHGVQNTSIQLDDSAITEVTTDESLLDKSETSLKNPNTYQSSLEPIPKYDLYKTWEEEPSAFLAKSFYEPDRDDVISLHEGEKVELLERPDMDWWLVRKFFDSRTGLVPSQLLRSKTDFDREISDLLSPMLHRIISDEIEYPCENNQNTNQLPAVMVELLKNVTAKDGEGANLECIIHGEPKPLIVWFYNQKILKPSPDFLQFYDDETRVCSLQIKEVYPEDGGRYTVVAKNSTGVASSSAELVVVENEMLKDESKTSSKELEPPSILAKPKSQFVNENEDATFTCKFKGGFTLQIFWLKEKQPIKPDNHINIVANEDSSGSIISKLSVKNCSLEDSGKYTVGAFGADGSSVDCTISLNVKASPKKMDFKMNLKKKEPFKKVEKKVEIERQTNIEETVNRKQMHSHTESSSLADNKRTTKTPAQLKEEQNQLYIVKKLQDIIVYEGETARFDCLISKFWPKQTVSWFFQNKPIESGEYYKKIENSEEKSVCLEVYEVHVDDAGLYTVRVSNDHGVVESSCFLKVEESTYEESFQTGPVLKKDDENMLSNQKSQQNAAQTSKPTNSLSKLGQQNSNQQNQQKNLQQKLNVFNGKKPENKNNEKVIHENTNKNGVSKTNKPDVTENKTNGLNISQKPNVLVQNKNDFSSSNEKAAKDQKASKSHNRSEAKQLVDKIKFEETCDYVLCQLKTENFQKDVEEEIIKVSIAVDLKASESKENIHCRNAEEEQNIQALEKIRLASEYQNVYLESFLKIDFLKNAILSLSFIKTNTLKISKKIFLNETFNLVSKSFQEDYKIQNFEVAVQSTVSEDEKVTENYLFKGETILNEIATISGTEVDLKAISDVSVDFYVSETTSETERENYIESISELYLSLAPQIDESSFPSNDICTGYYESVQNNIVFTIVLIESVSISNELVDRAFTEVFVDKTEENIGHDTFKTIDSDKYLTVDGVLIEKIETNKVAFTDYLILLVLAPICYTIITHEINSQIEELKKKEKKAKLKTLHDLETYKTDRSQTDSETASLSEIVKILESKEADFEQKHSKIKETFIAKQDFSQIKMGIFESTIEQTIENVLQAGINLINENSLNELNQNSEKKITSEVVLNAIDNTNTINYKASCVLNTLPVGDFSTFTIKELKARCVGIDVMIIANDCLKKNKCEITQKFSEIKSKEDIIKIKKVEELLIDKDSPLMLKKDIGFVIKKKPASFSAKKCISDDINTKEPLDKKEVEETCMFKPASSNQTRPDAILDELHKINATKKETNLKLENESFKKKNEEKFMVEKKAKNARNISQTNSSKSQKSHEIATVEKPIIKPVVNFSEKTEVQKVISQVLYKGKNLNHASNILNTLSIEEQEKSKGFERIAVINGHENIVHRKQQNRRPIFQQNMDVSLNVGSSTNITIPFVSESSNTLKIIWVKLKKLKATEGVLTIEKTVQNFREKSQKLDSFADINTQDYEIDEKAKLEYETTTNETFMVLKNVQRHRDDGLYEARLTDEFGEARCLVRVSVKENPCSPENLRLHLLEKSASKLHLTKKKEFNVLLTWDPPIDDGGDQIMNYIIERLDGPTETWVYCITISSERTQIKIPASLFFKSIAFRVAAQNKCGIGNFSNPSENILNISKGTNIPPWFVRKFPVKMEVREGTPMNFFCSSNSETSDSSSYAFKDTDSMYDKQSFASSNSTLDNLDFLSESIPFFEDTIPCAPSNLIVEPAGDSNKEVLARWWPPKNLNEKMLKTISGYILEKRVIGEDDWKVLAKLPFDVMECEIGDLAKNKKYVLRVAVEMKDGETCPSRELCEPFEIDDTHGTIVGCVPPKPNQPIVLEDLDGNNSCKVEWKVEISELSKSSQIDVILFEENKKTTDKPNSVLHYIVERKETRGPQRFKVIQQIVKSPPLVVEDLEEKVEYEFKVLACNTSGNSAPSDPSKPFVFRSKDEKAVRFIKKLKDQIVKVNECAVFECKVVGNPLPKIKWFKNFSEIFSDARHEIVTKKDTGESCFLILNVKEEDCGEVECRAFNPLLTTSSRATLNVHIPPKLRTSSKTFENLQFVGGTKVKARIPLSSNPFPTVEWFKAGELITESERISFEKDEHSVTLCIKDSTKEDSGAYAVKVKNYLGIDQVEFDITVTGKPAKLQTPPKVTKVSDSSCKLEWLECSDNGGSPIVEYILEISDDKDVQNWKTVGKSNTTKSEIKGLAPNRTYTFAVRAKNIFGLSERSPPSEAISLKKLRLQQSSLYDKYVKSGCERNQIDVSRLKCETALSSKYKIYEEISRGPFGAMHRAEDRVSGDSWLARFVMTTPLDKMLLKQEISIINNLRHPNILVLQDAYETDGEIASIFELLSGPDLLTRLADESQCRHTELKRIEYMKQICNAIKYLHENNLLHLDIKPETIIFETSSSKKLKLCGLGSTKLLVADRCTKVYHSSVNHLPPEILKFSPVSFASDMWSLGILAFNIISGKHLVPGKTVEEVSENILSNHDLFSKACIAKLLKEASDHCHDWISRCLVKDSHKRMTINEALCHSWLNGDAEKELKDQQLSSGSIESLNQLLSQLDRDNDVIAIGFLAHEGEDFLRIANNSKDFERDITMELPDQAPAVMTELSNSEVYEGSVARFKCKFQGRPDPTVEWYHENKKLEEETSKLAGMANIMSKWGFWSKNGVAMLSINDVTEEDAGTYECKASNSLGCCSTSGELSVQTFSWKARRSRRSVSVKSNGDDDDLMRMSLPRDSVNPGKS